MNSSFINKASRKMQLVIAGFAGMLLLVQAAVPLRAQETRTLSLQEAVQLGIENSKQLKISLAKADAAESKYQQTMDLALPVVNLNAGYSRLSEVPAYRIQFPGEAESHELFPVYLNSYQ